MRKRSLGLLLAVAAITASAASPSGIAGACAGSPPPAPAGLPSPVVLQTSCGRFTVNTDGRVISQPGASRPVPAGAGWWPDGRWWKVVRGHLLVGRWHETLWQSHGSFRPVSGVGALVFGTNLLAFSYGPHERLYIAHLDGTERRVTVGEAPLAWTKYGELLTISMHGGRVFSRTADGRIRRTLAVHVSTLATAPDGALFFLDRGRVMSSNGERPTSLAKLSDLGFARTPALEPLGTLLALHDLRRLVVVHADGSPFASTALPRRQKRTDFVSSAVTANAAGDAVAYTATSGNTALGSAGTETTYLLRAGDTAATPIHSEHVDFSICERMAALSWHEHWLLYSASEGNIAVLDSTGASPAIDLGAFARALPGAVQDDNGEGDLNIDASWATT